MTFKDALKAVAMGLLAASPCQGAFAEELPLIDFAKPGAEALVKPNGNPDAIDFKIVDGDGKKALETRCHGGDEGFPGVVIMPENGVSWDLSAFGAVEVKISNLGEKALSVNIRIDNDGDWKETPWNANGFSVAPGKTATGKAVFGFSWGKPSFKLDSSKATKLLVFTGKAKEERLFRIDSVTAVGKPGEKPDGYVEFLKPKDGAVFSADKPAGARIDWKGAKGEIEGGALKVAFEEASKEKLQGVAIKAPEHTLLDLSDFTQVEFRLKNAGQAPLKLRCRVEGKNSNGVDNCVESEASIEPGEAKAVSVPFDIGKPWTRGAKNSGSRLSSCDVAGILITAEAPLKGAALEVSSVKASLGVASIPEWLGKRPPVEGDWVMSFEDNFDGDAIDQTKWSYYGPNYWDKKSHWSKDDVAVGGGVAKLRYERKSGFHNDNPKEKRSDYAAGFLETYGKWTQLYGYFEARMKLPEAPGLWPAFWMMPDRGESAGPQWKRQSTADGGMEFDIMEGLTRWGAHRYNIAMHWDGYEKGHKMEGHDRIYATPDKDGFITCGLLWLPGLAVYYCNGKEVLRWEGERVSSVQSDMMFTLPQGGWDNNAIDDSKLPADFVIDYVRVWQRKDLMKGEAAAVK